jgi:hypothetical protein
MKDIYTLAEQFLNLIERKGSTVDPSTDLVKVAAGRKHRKQLEKDLAYAKDVYNKRRLSLESHEKTHSDLASVIDKERNDVARHRADIMRCYDVMRNMDVHNISEVRFMNDDVGYVKGKRLFRLDENQALVPFKRKKQLDELDMEMVDDEPELEDEENADDELTADDLLASLV